MSREKRVSGIRRLFAFPASPRRVQREVDEEIGFHLESRVAELVDGWVRHGTRLSWGAVR